VKIALPALVFVLLSAGVAAGAGNDPDPGAVAAALQVLPSLRTATFDGPYARYRGYLSETADAAFATAYRSAVAQAVPPSIAAHDPWMMPFGGVESPAQLVGFDGKSYLWASACRPHDCPNGNVFVIYDPIGHGLWGAVHADENVFVFGAPGGRQKGFLLDMIVDNVLQQEDGYRADREGMIRKVLRDTNGSFTRVLMRRF
jgi:hypothetical protein